MRKTIRTILTLCCLLILIDGIEAQNRTWQWLRSGGGSYQTLINSTCTDPSGNIYVAGSYFGDTLVMGADTLYNDSHHGQRLLIVKYDPQGNVLWARGAHGYNVGFGNTTIFSQAQSICTDATGAVYAVGDFQGCRGVFGHDTLVDPDSTQRTPFMVKYDASGHEIWARGVQVSHGAGFYAVCANKSGDVFVIGNFTDQFRMGTTNFNVIGGNMITARYDSSGALIWAKAPSYAGSMQVQGYGIAANDAGEVSVTGFFQQSTLNFDAIVIHTPNTSGGGSAFIAKYDASGHVLWANSTWGSPNVRSRGQAVAMDPTGNVYASGYFSDASYISFGTDTIRVSQQLTENLFLVKYDASGQERWLRSTLPAQQGLGAARGRTLIADATGHVYLLAGLSDATYCRVDGDSIWLGAQSNERTLYIAQYDSTGHRDWIHTGGMTPSGLTAYYTLYMSMSPQGAFYVSGPLNLRGVSFDSLTATCTAGTYDYYLAKLDTTGTIILGVQESEPLSGMAVYPNPSSGLVYISTGMQHSQLTVTDATGRIVLRRELTEAHTSIDLGTAAPGLYLLRVEGTEGSETRKVVIGRE